MTWFRREPGLVWLDLRPNADPGATAEAILRLLAAGTA
jgi:hypothetical protein